MTTDFRALSAELLAEIKSMGAQSSRGAEIYENDDLIYRAIDALAEPLSEPPSLKEQALALLHKWSVVELRGGEEDDLNADMDTIRKALEALPND